ncbi:uncharacterized protein N7446_009186 [Penicillium canescens]|uniref:BZIP domain-containing protein n=1 Tax=Penicillium canescens TaxID=5083 RepID=A0AAD6I7E1_PENCN|nr:uncharacterized protein N7446_009186 [Penicillium canescens]KAJ6034436.1 hypothetical protein N7460_008611 [Penicillium canescens]KAJ6046095.1 hypothetical protein N7444_007349 [Penicillium canescens]KAJ6053174.1 hypothetical protein N7446_009186 [Penicillium canescens]
MATMLEHSSTIKSLEPDTQFVIPAATVWSNPSHITCKGDDFPPEDLRTKQGSEKTANLLLNQELRPQVEPKSRPRRGSKIQPSQDAVSPERARYLERNRIAANKCRLKKKQEREEIQRMLQKETAKRNALLAEVKKLKEETWRLKNGVFAHAKCGDHRINLQLTKMTQQLLEKSSLLCPSVLDITFSDTSDGGMKTDEEGLKTNLSTVSPASSVDDTATCAEIFNCYIDLPNM